MLRIQELDSGDLVTFVLSGRIEKEDLGELKYLVEKHDKSVVLDRDCLGPRSLVAHYERVGRPDEAARWRARLSAAR